MAAQLNDRKTIKQKQEKLSAVVKTLLFLGRDGWALRDYRDAGALCENGKEDTFAQPEGDGVFRSVLQFCIDAGVTALAPLIEDSPANACYTPTTV